MLIETRPIGDVLPYSRNARKIPQSAIDKVAASLAEFDWQQPIVVDAAGVIVAGHTRWLAAKKLGLEVVPVHVATELSPAQVKAYRLMDNRSHQEATWDMELLAPELSEIRGLAEIDLALTGFDASELDAMFAGTSQAADQQQPAGGEDDTTIAAAHVLGRRGAGTEISPAYCDVIVRRIQKLAGVEAVLAETGETFAEVAADRGVPAEVAA